MEKAGISTKNDVMDSPVSQSLPIALTSGGVKEGRHSCSTFVYTSLVASQRESPRHGLAHLPAPVVRDEEYDGIVEHSGILEDFYQTAHGLVHQADLFWFGIFDVSFTLVRTVGFSEEAQINKDWIWSELSVSKYLS